MKQTSPNDAKRRREEERTRWDMRDPFSIDVDRILHSRAYTSYTDKTQVFYLVGQQGISHRVIHVQLLSRIARTIGRRLKLNEDLIEAISIGHDIGHPPFGHDGETYLDKMCQEAGIGRFRHNVQGVRMLEIVEKGGKGLNLTLEVLDGILCHNGEISEQALSPEGIHDFASLDNKMEEAKNGGNPIPGTPEACLVRMADTISYIGRDIEDAISLGIISRYDIPQSPRDVLGDTNGKIVYTLVEDLISNSGGSSITYSNDIFNALKELKAFNYENIYLNPKVKSESKKIEVMYELIFKRLVEDIVAENDNSIIFHDFIDRMDTAYVNDHLPAEIVRDYIASLTDSAFLRLFNRLFIPEMPA